MNVTAPFSSDVFVEGQATESESQDWDYIFFMAIRTWMLEVRTAFPAEIVSIISTNYVNVQPHFNRKYKTLDTAVKMPIIQNVPVQMPNNGTYAIKLPIQIGDIGLCIVADRSLDLWKGPSGGGPIDPMDPRLHHVTDAIFIPGINTLDDPIVPPTTATTLTDLVLMNGESAAILQAAGTFLFKGAEAELMNLLVGITTALQTTLNALVTTNQNLGQAVTATMLGPNPLSNATSYTQAATQLQQTVTTLQQALTNLTVLMGE